MSPAENHPNEEATVQLIFGYINGGDNDEDDIGYTDRGYNDEDDSEDNNEEDIAKDVNKFELIVGYADGGKNDRYDSEDNDEEGTAKDVNEFEGSVKKGAIVILHWLECYESTPQRPTSMIEYEPSTFDPFTWIPVIHNGALPSFEEWCIKHRTLYIIVPDEDADKQPDLDAD